jgi:hypothetical protein
LFVIIHIQLEKKYDQWQDESMQRLPQLVPLIHLKGGRLDRVSQGLESDVDT